MCVCVCEVVGNRCTTWVYLCTVMPKVSYNMRTEWFARALPTRRAEALFSAVIPFFSLGDRDTFYETKHPVFFFSFFCRSNLGHYRLQQFKPASHCARILIHIWDKPDIHSLHHDGVYEAPQPASTPIAHGQRSHHDSAHPYGQRQR